LTPTVAAAREARTLNHHPWGPQHDGRIPRRWRAHPFHWTGGGDRRSARVEEPGQSLSGVFRTGRRREHAARRDARRRRDAH